jgi:plasmid stabilization system protein ParE
MTVRIRPEAEADFAAAYTYYEGAAEGLGGEFLRSVEATLAMIERNPHLYAMIHADVRRALLRRFPYGVFYVISDGEIVVLGCFHARRDPAQWQRRFDADS